MKNTITNFLMINGSSKLRQALSRVFVEYRVFEIDYRMITVLMLNVDTDIDTVEEFELLHDKYYEDQRFINKE